MWEKNPFFDPSALIVYDYNYNHKCLACTGAYADVNTARACPGFCLWREVNNQLCSFNKSEAICNFFQGIKLCALVSTGTKAWQICVDGQVYLTTWANIGIRWIPTNINNSNANLGGIELYINGVVVGESKLEMNQKLDGTSNFVQVGE